MSTETAVRFEFRCSTCWQSLYAAVDEAGTTVECSYCHKSMTIPDATEERIHRAVEADPEENGCEEGAFVEDERLTREQINELAKQRAAVAAAENPNTRSTVADSAARFRRLLAVIVDSLCYGFAGFLGALVLFALVGGGVIQIDDPGPSPTVEDIPWEPVAIIGFLPLMLAFVNWNLIATQGQTIGKMLLGIRIVDSAGCPPGFFRGVVLRNWVRALLNSFIPFFGLVDIALIALDPPRCIHDHIAGTYVVNVS